MTTKRSPDYERIFWRIALSYTIHHGLLRLAHAHRHRRLAAHLDRHIRKKINYIATPPSAPLLQEYLSAMSKAVFWHGTGRLQYTLDGSTVDVLKAILERGTLTPTRDVYSIVLTGKEMVSLSATTVRIIGRSYADTHGRGVHEANRYGSSLWWVAYYYNLCYFEILLKHGHTLRKNWRKFNQASSGARGERTWGKKVHSKAKSVWDTFGLGSDIPGNYPILFGITGNVQTAELPKMAQKWEVRITEPVTLKTISHIEVPQDKVAEVRKLLAAHQCTIPVFPLELGEYAASQLSLAELLGL